MILLPRLRGYEVTSNQELNLVFVDVTSFGSITVADSFFCVENKDEVVMRDLHTGELLHKLTIPSPSCFKFLKNDRLVVANSFSLTITSYDRKGELVVNVIDRNCSGN